MGVRDSVPPPSTGTKLRAWVTAKDSCPYGLSICPLPTTTSSTLISVFCFVWGRDKIVYLELITTSYPFMSLVVHQKVFSIQDLVALQWEGLLEHLVSCTARHGI